MGGGASQAPVRTRRSAAQHLTGITPAHDLQSAQPSLGFNLDKALLAALDCCGNRQSLGVSLRVPFRPPDISHREPTLLGRVPTPPYGPYPHRLFAVASDDADMAAVQQRLQAHARTRSGQIAANTSRSLQAAAPPSRNRVASPTSSPTPPLTIFVTNLKLLDLDLLPDWPGISPETFSTAGVPSAQAQGQKKRIQCVEWALFQLFALWDPEETANVSLQRNTTPLPTSG